MAGRIAAGDGRYLCPGVNRANCLSFQAILGIYTALSNVGPDNSPFQLLDASHRDARVFFNAIEGGLRRALIPDHRYPGRTLVTAERQRLNTFIALAGTMILFDGSTIHRGSPIVSGMCYVPANYYYEPEHIVPVTESIFSAFSARCSRAACPCRTPATVGCVEQQWGISATRTNSIADRSRGRPADGKA